MPPGQVIFTIALKLTASQVKRRVENFSRLQSPGQFRIWPNTMNVT